MRLKRLEIYGFKSFADRTVVVFDEGITGIVGPNGSGKSNLSDAVRWVLGEQSAKALRGGKMEDVIFNGTQKRKRLGYCEVSLVFDNEDHALAVDFAEVMITRRVYRSGEGEYYINKAACRLRDIIELFRDTGLGKEGYSIIGQGRIGEILSQKSEDRRGIFEEAAGIVKYRTRKEESEKRLANMRDNLSRVEDIISELESQLEQLEYAVSYSADASDQAALDTEIQNRLLIMNQYVARGDMNAAIDSTAAICMSARIIGHSSTLHLQSSPYIRCSATSLVYASCKVNTFSYICISIRIFLCSNSQQPSICQPSFKISFVSTYSEFHFIFVLCGTC